MVYQKEKKKNRAEEMFEIMLMENYQIVMKSLLDFSSILGSQRRPTLINIKQNKTLTSRHSKCKLQKSKEKEKNLKGTKGWGDILPRQEQGKNYTGLFVREHASKMNGVKYLMD